jgi:hypothetical protein
MNHSTALPIAWIALRILIVLNWIFGACIFALLVYTFVNPAWTMKALEVTGLPNAGEVMWGMRAIAALGVAACVLNHVILVRLVAMVETVRTGDPFVAANAYRLNAVAWLLLFIQLISIIIAAIGKFISTPGHEFNLDAGFSTNGWLAVILIFVLARVFAEGTLMREDLEGTV